MSGMPVGSELVKSGTAVELRMKFKPSFVFGVLLFEEREFISVSIVQLSLVFRLLAERSGGYRYAATTNQRAQPARVAYSANAKGYMLTYRRTGI